MRWPVGDTAVSYTGGGFAALAALAPVALARAAHLKFSGRSLEIGRRRAGNTQPESIPGCHLDHVIRFENGSLRQHR